MSTARRAKPASDGRLGAAPDGLTAGPPVGLYIHIPFCVSLCPYCDFVVVAGAATRFAVFLSTGHAGQFLPRGREVEEIDAIRRPPKGWRVIGPREPSSRDR